MKMILKIKKFVDKMKSKRIMNLILLLINIVTTQTINLTHKNAKLLFLVKILMLKADISLIK
jgi:hypothetical protein